MDEIVESTIELARNKLQSQPADPDVNSMMRFIPDDFDKLLNSQRTDQLLLYCRQMKRMMDYNDSIPFKLLYEWHEDICCLIDELNGQQRGDESPQRFFNKINFEKELEKRALQFYKSFSSRKTFTELWSEHETFFENYRQKCVSLHSKIRVQGLMRNIDDFLSIVYQIEHPQLTKRKQLQQKLQYLEIDFDCSKQIFQSCEINFIPNNFLPSVKHLDITCKKNSFETIEELLKSNRWLVILGEPGSGKSTLLQWLTNQYSKNDSTHIPILIRIGNLAEWLMSNQTKTLIDYINWVSEHVYKDNGEKILKKSIDHGQALVLLDGLDEISKFEQRKQIVDLVRQFIDEHIRAPDFISPFDYKTVRRDQGHVIFKQVIETPSPSHSHGNQIIITSRSIGYTLHPIVGSFIKHYTLLPMKEKEAKQFANRWLNLVEENIINIFNSENIQLNEQRRFEISKQRVCTIESMFQMLSPIFTTNPWLLSLICSSVIQSSEPIYFNSRIELYDHVIQASLSDERIEQLDISKTIFINFLIDLSVYLHLNSPSGLIDEFDIKKLCCYSLKQQTGNLFKSRTELYKYVDSLINLLDSSLGFIVQRGLQVYGFQHLSFQEYFVAQCLIRNSTMEQIAKRIHSLTINFRFHESISLAVGLISFNRSLNDYEQFCQYLVNPVEEYSIPFGIILLFNSIYDMKNLPSTPIVILALDKLFNQPSYLIVSTYFFWNLSKLPYDIIIEWMQSCLKNDQSISKFCQCLAKRRDKKLNKIRYIPNLSPIIYQQLWSLHSRNLSIEFDIDQVLRIVMLRDDITDQIFNNELVSCLSPINNSVANVHPLILAVIIAVSGGVYYQMEDTILKILFSTKKMHRQSLIFTPIIEYLRTNQELNSSHIQSLIEYYEKHLVKCSPTDTSSVTVDTFIALICLKGLSDISFYEKYQNYQTLSFALERFKWNWFHFMLSGLCIHLGTYRNYQTSFIKSEIEIIIDTFSRQFNQSDEQKQSFTLACAAALRKLRIFEQQGLPKILEVHYNRAKKHRLLILLTCLPKSLQKLYICSVNASTHTVYSLPLVVFLVNCLDQVKNIKGDGPMIPCALSILKSLLMECLLENYALAIFRERYSNIGWISESYKDCDAFYIQKSFDWQTIINIEHERINLNLSALENQENDLRLFSALISFCRILQAAARLNNHFVTGSISNKEIYFAITTISNPVLRIIAFSIILHMTKPMVVDIKQTIEIRDEMIGLLFSLILDLPLLTSTYLFIQCYPERIHFLELFQEMSILIGRKLNEQTEEQQAAFIALRQLDDPYLSEYLTTFARKTTNLSDLLHFNSTIFYHYLQNISTFPTCNTNLLSLMYLNELTFDAQNLKIFIDSIQKNSSMTITQYLRQLWQESPKDKKILTYKIAVVISKYLQQLDKHIISSLMKDIHQCVSIEEQAIPVIQQWLDYKFDKDLYPFAQFAALELLIAGSNAANLMNFVNEMFEKNDCNRLIFVAERLFNSSFIDLRDFRQILVALKQHNHLTKVSVAITRKKTLDLILQLELEQPTTNMYPSFLLMIESCSSDLQIYLLDYIKHFFNEQYQLENSMNEEFVAMIVKCIIELLIQSDLKTNFYNKLYKFIFILMHHSKYPRTQMAIINILETIIDHAVKKKKVIPMQSDMIENFQKVIDQWKNYSENFLNVCLLSYGNLLLELQLSQQNVNISNIIEQKLHDIYKEYSFEILSIRAAFCLEFGKSLHLKSTVIVSWFNKTHNIDVNTQLTILLQSTLFGTYDKFYNLEEIKNHFNLYPQSMKMFVMNFYDYLDNDNNKKYIHDRSIDYIRITKSILGKDSQINMIFFDAIRNSSFDEKQFKTKLYNHSNKYPNDRANSIFIYSSFGIVTYELLDMLDSVDQHFSDLNFASQNFTQISDEYAVEKLFSLLNKKRNRSVYKYLLNILKDLIKADAISSLEVHRQLRVSPNTSSGSKYQWDLSEEEIFDLLLEISCFNNEKATLYVEKSFTTTSGINDAFYQQLIRTETELHLPCEDNRFLHSEIPATVCIKYI